MAKGKILPTTRAVPQIRRKRQVHTTSNPESSLLLVRMKELDREFARQTKQLTALTKKLGKKIASFPTDKSSKLKD